MRNEINFRGLSEDGNRLIISDGLLISKKGVVIMIESEDEQGLKTCPIKEGSVDQFTGKFDKNGVRIYGRDLIISFNKHYEDEPSLNCVCFLYGCVRLISIGKNDIPLYNYQSEDLEVIGSLHNKNLSEEAKQLLAKYESYETDL